MNIWLVLLGLVAAAIGLKTIWVLVGARKTMRELERWRNEAAPLQTDTLRQPTLEAA